MVNASDRPKAALGAANAAAPWASDGRAPCRLAVAVVLFLGLGGCSYMPSTASLPALPGLDLFEAPRQVRGHMVDEEDLRQIVAGVSSRRDVEALLGSPSATGTFDDSEWFYIGGVTRQRPGRQLALEQQQVVLIRFDARDTVRDVRRIGQEEGRAVRVVERTTPSPGNERTLLQQLFGNIGRVGPGLGAQGGATGPGAPGPASTR